MYVSRHPRCTINLAFVPKSFKVSYKFGSRAINPSRAAIVSRAPASLGQRWGAVRRTQNKSSFGIADHLFMYCVCLWIKSLLILLLPARMSGILG